VLAGRCRLPGRLSRLACQAFQGSLSLSRGWKCRAGDGLPWQPHCFQTLRGRERKVCFSRLTKATTTMDAGQALLKITAVLPDTRASRGQRGTMHPGAAGTERSGAGRVETWGFFLPSPQQIKPAVSSPQQCYSIATRDVSLYLFAQAGSNQYRSEQLQIAFSQLGAPRSPLCSHV